MSNILSFPTNRARAVSPLPVVVPAHSRGLHGVQLRRFMDFAELTARLGLDLYADRRTQIEKLRLLHDQAGMPPPHNPHSRAGRLLFGADAIHAGSLWERGRMLMWLDNPIGPDGDPGTAAAHPDYIHPDVAEREVARLMDRAAGMCAKANRA
jgi:hypothetical protein